MEHVKVWSKTLMRIMFGLSMFGLIVALLLPALNGFIGDLIILC
jgi:NADH:ubiquinone oxidoreductase subunit 4 (subunit M)